MGLFTISVKVEESLTNRKIFEAQKNKQRKLPKEETCGIGNTGTGAFPIKILTVFGY